jgi:hypothetical protein
MYFNGEGTAVNYEESYKFFKVHKHIIYSFIYTQHLMYTNTHILHRQPLRVA